jgi:hypothetical protein
MPEIREAGARNEAHITRSNHCDAHELILSSVLHGLLPPTETGLTGQSGPPGYPLDPPQRSNKLPSADVKTAESDQTRRPWRPAGLLSCAKTMSAVLMVEEVNLKRLLTRMLSDRTSSSETIVPAPAFPKPAATAGRAWAGRMVRLRQVSRQIWRKCALFVELFVSRGQGYARR